MSDSTPNPDATLRGLARQARLSDRVAQDIVKTIVRQHLQPGDALPPERELGEQFGVSRTVIREAVRALEARGLLDVRVGSRIRVAALDPETLHDAIWHFVRSRAIDRRTISEARDALAVAIGRLAAERATQADLERITRALHRDEAELLSAVTKAAHSELLTVLAMALAGLSSPVQSGRASGRPAGHDAVLAALGRRDPEEAGRAVRDLLAHRLGDGTAGD